jgi:hypothetical protein
MNFGGEFILSFEAFFISKISEYFLEKNGLKNQRKRDRLEAVVRDPTWMDLPPVSCVAAAPVTITSTNVNTKTQVTLVVLATEQQILMPKTMQCDVEGVKYLLQEFTDGNRNISRCL